MSERPLIILAVPGCWASRSELLGAVAEQSGGYLYVGDLLSEIGAGKTWKIEVQDPNPQLPRAFAAGGRGAFGAADLAAIARHTMILYLLGTGGSEAEAAGIMRAAAGLLRAGGLAVNVESTGASLTRAAWLELAADGSHAALFQAFVTLIGTGTEVRSCGMHNLGLPDACVVEPPTAEAAHLLQSFLYYTLVEQPQLASDQTFSLAPDAPYYRLTREPCQWYPADDPFFNPYGIWRMARL